MKSLILWVRAHKKISIAVIFLIVVVAFGASIRSKISKIERIPIKKGDMNTSIYGSAQLKTDRSFDLKIGTSAKIIEVRTSTGSKVKRSDLLIVFDNLPSFRAPIDGVVTALNFKNGETAFAQSTVLSIVDPKDFYLEMSLDQKSIRFIKEGQAARISFDGYRDLKIDGSVKSTFSNNGLFYGVINIQTVDSSFLPGMSADVAIVIESKKDVLLAPLGSISDGKILVERNNRPEEVSVATGIDDGKYVEIQNSNLIPGDLALIRSSLPGPAQFKAKGGP
jgi:multidrug efflux pump subunit AcrA (membrane-fusion protein)